MLSGSAGRAVLVVCAAPEPGGRVTARPPGRPAPAQRVVQEALLSADARVRTEDVGCEHCTPSTDAFARIER